MDFEAVTDFGKSEEIPFLDQALNMSSEIMEELQSTINYLRKLSFKYGAPSVDDLNNFTPGNIWTEPEHLTCNDALINEKRQEHDLNLPQQHHKVQEINDDSSSSDSSTPSSRIINHPEVKQGSEFNLDKGAGGDRKSLNQQTESSDADEGCVESPTSLDYLTMSKLKTDVIKTKHEIQSAIAEVQWTESRCKLRALRCNNYLFIKTSTRKTETLSKEIRLSHQTISSVSRKISKSSIGVEQAKRPSTGLIAPQSTRSMNFN